MGIMLFIDFTDLRILNSNLIFIATPFLTWTTVGFIKFSFNSYKAKKLAFNLIGYGGFPSNHSAIVSSTISLIFFEKGLSDPAIWVALTLAFIVFLDASSLRGQVEQQAKLINILSSYKKNYPKLRERIGHTRMEIFAGGLLGFLIGYLIHFLASHYLVLH